MMKKKKSKMKFIAFTILFIVIMTIILSISINFSFVNDKDIFITNGFGEVTILQSSSLSHGKAFQLFSYWYEGYQCGVDDARIVTCLTTKGADSIGLEGETPSGFNNVYTVTRTFGDIGWNKYDSCAGWMNYWRCAPTSCKYINAGVCQGSASDSEDIDCSYDNDCRIVSGKIRKCIMGGCVYSIQGSECDYKYRCDQGIITTCNDGVYETLTTCWYVKGVEQCKDDGAYITVENTDVANYRDLCASQCNSDSQCKANEVCRNGQCIDETGEGTYDDLTKQLEELNAIKVQCIEEGLFWTGTECIDENAAEQEVVNDISELDSEKCSEDYSVQCTDGTSVVYLKCNDLKLYEKTMNQCSTGVQKKKAGESGVFDSLISFFNNNLTVIIIVIFVIATVFIGFTYYKNYGKR